jgi:hypothetical protein
MTLRRRAVAESSHPRKLSCRNPDSTKERDMLELRPACEQCNKALPPDSLDARICSFECTFCSTCATDILGNVCPNCGGGFVPRPVRPSRNWKGDNFLGKDPASTRVRHRPVDPAAHAKFAAPIRGIPPDKR